MLLILGLYEYLSSFFYFLFSLHFIGVFDYVFTAEIHFL